MGFDVWLANSPGSNSYSTHEFLHRYEPTYWAYGPYSPAVNFVDTMKYIKEATGTKKDVLVIAYSNAAW